MRRALVTIVALLFATVLLRGQTPAAHPAATPPAPAPAKAQTPTPAPAPATNAPAPAAPNVPAKAADAKPADVKPGDAKPGDAKPGDKAPVETPAETFTYNPDGRRDPFTNLLTGSGDRSAAPSRRSDGVTGLTVSEISVRGILQSRGTLVAMVQGPDNKTYILHQGDRLLDGSIKSITAQGLVLIQDVNDPLSLVKQREVSKLLRSLEGVK